MIAGRYIYTVKAKHGQFIAFWQKSTEIFEIFTPHGMTEEYLTYPVQEWNEIREYSNQKHPNNKKYDEIVNAVWNYLGIRKILFDKDNVQISKNASGTFCPRIWRGFYEEGNPPNTYNIVNPRLVYSERYVQSIVAASSLFAYLEDIFRYVEPSSHNFGTFSHKIRELLILACTEIESNWRSVLRDNTKKHKSAYTTNDYFRVKEPLHLEKWSVILYNYPRLDPLTPFENWNRAQPTQSLPWYSAYNAVKHNREGEFPHANFNYLINSMAALYIMQLAQWGPQIYNVFFDNLTSPFYLIKYPIFEANEVYVPGIDQAKKKSIFYFEK